MPDIHNFRPSDIVKLRHDRSSQNRFIHALHNTEDCQEPKFKIEFPDQSNEEENIPTLKGIVPVRIYLDEQNKKRLTQNRFEIMLYLYNVFLFEEENGLSPFTYI